MGKTYPGGQFSSPKAKGKLLAGATRHEWGNKYRVKNFFTQLQYNNNMLILGAVRFGELDLSSAWTWVFTARQWRGSAAVKAMVQLRGSPWGSSCAQNVGVGCVQWVVLVK